MNKIKEIFIREVEKQKKNIDISSYVLMGLTIFLVVFGMLGLAVICSLSTTLLLVTSNTLQNKIFVLERELIEQDIEEHISK